MIGPAGTGFDPPQEAWTATTSLAFVEIDGKRILHQWWTSNIGRSMWRPVVEITRYFAETGQA
jgi:hypothetical protein